MKVHRLLLLSKEVAEEDPRDGLQEALPRDTDAWRQFVDIEYDPDDPWSFVGARDAAMLTLRDNVANDPRESRTDLRREGAPAA